MELRIYFLYLLSQAAVAPQIGQHTNNLWQVKPKEGKVANNVAYAQYADKRSKTRCCQYNGPQHCYYFELFLFLLLLCLLCHISSFALRLINTPTKQVAELSSKGTYVTTLSKYTRKLSEIRHEFVILQFFS